MLKKLPQLTKSWHWNVLFAIIFIWMAWLYGIFDTMNRGPYSVHQWRQADCLSITENYHAQNLPFLEPQIHRQQAEKNGQTISELPLVYYTVAKLWSWFGKHHWMYRLLSFLVFALGIFYLKKTADRALKDRFWSIFIALFLFTSPIIAYYSNNFLMNSYALGIALIGSYHFYRYYEEERYKHLIFACLLFLLAGLLKITALLVFLAVGGAYFFHLLKRRPPLQSIIKVIVPYLIVLVLIFSWQLYIDYYNSLHMSNIFLQGTLPYWDLEQEHAAKIWERLWNNILPQVYSSPLLFLIGALYLTLVLNFKKLNTSLFNVATFLVFGILAYFVLFFSVFDVHDYYLINATVVVPVILLLFLLLLKSDYAPLFHSMKTKLLAAVVLLGSVYYTAVHTRIKYDAGNGWVKSSFLLSKEKKGFWEFHHWWYNETFKDLETIDPYLTSIGCDRSKKVISIPDQSINISLYLMNRKGYTDFGNHKIVKEQRIEKAKEWGAEYLIICDKRLLDSAYIQPFLSHKVGQTKNVSIFKL